MRYTIGMRKRVLLPTAVAAVGVIAVMGVGSPATITPPSNPNSGVKQATSGYNTTPARFQESVTYLGQLKVKRAGKNRKVVVQASKFKKPYKITVRVGKKNRTITRKKGNLKRTFSKRANRVTISGTGIPKGTFKIPNRKVSMNKVLKVNVPNQTPSKGYYAARGSASDYIPISYDKNDWTFFDPCTYVTQKDRWGSEWRVGQESISNIIYYHGNIPAVTKKAVTEAFKRVSHATGWKFVNQKVTNKNNIKLKITNHPNSYGITGLAGPSGWNPWEKIGNTYISTHTTAELSAKLNVTNIFTFNDNVSLLMHEIGHALGLGHAKSPTQNMYGTVQSQNSDARFGRGDKTGFKKVGYNKCIWPLEKLTPEELPDND